MAHPGLGRPLPLLDELADNVADVVRAHDRPIALAESFSGPVLLQVLARKPALLRGVTFCASFATCPRPVLLRLASVMPLRWLFRLPLPGALIRALCVEAKSPPELIDDVTATRILRPGRGHTRRQMQDLTRYSSAFTLHRDSWPRATSARRSACRISEHTQSKRVPIPE